MQKRWYGAHLNINLPAFFCSADNVFIFQYGVKLCKVTTKLFAPLSCFIPWERPFVYEIILAWWECIISWIVSYPHSYTGWVKRLWPEYGASCWNGSQSDQRKMEHSDLFLMDIAWKTHLYFPFHTATRSPNHIRLTCHLSSHWCWSSSKPNIDPHKTLFIWTLHRFIN